MMRPNILLVVLDATRADACSCYGAQRLTTPSLDMLAATGTLYEQAISAAPWTLPAFASLFTGFFPNQLNIYERRRLAAGVPTLASVLSEDGYTTFGVTANSWMGDDFGLQRGFAQFHKMWQLFQNSQDLNELSVLSKAPESVSRFRSLLSQWRVGNPLANLINSAYNRAWAYRRDQGSQLVHRVLSWVRTQSSPWFAFVHFMEPHLEYKPPRSLRNRFVQCQAQARQLIQQDQMRMAWRHIAGVERLSDEELATWRDLYFAEVARADAELGKLLVMLDELGQLEQTVVIVTADHGESLGEHGLLSHQYGVYDHLIRVPLVIRYRPGFPAGARIPNQVQTLDLFASILRIAGMDSQHPTSLILPPHGEPRSFTVAQYGIPRPPHDAQLRRYGLRSEDVQHFARGFCALRDERYKLIAGTDGSVQLYDWQNDREEQEDLSVELPNITRELLAKLETWERDLEGIKEEDEPEEWEMDPSTAARLRGLGYIE
jgi:arylsulfatase A-like enzyme